MTELDRLLAWADSRGLDPTGHWRKEVAAYGPEELAKVEATLRELKFRSIMVARQADA